MNDCRFDSMIELEGVSKRFGDVVAVDGVSTTFGSGLTHVLLGSSGSGKSTILRLILGLTPPDSGSIRVDGLVVEPANRRALLGRMGYVVQEGGLYPHLTARRNVTLAAEAQGWDRGRIDARLNELAALVGFDGAILQLHPDEISGGQRQRVSLMRALMLDPPLLLLDEPLGSLDPLVRADLQHQLKEIFTPLGKTVVIVTHDIGEAAYFGHTITLMTEGRIVQQGTFADLSRRPASDFVTAFLNAQRPPPDMRELLA
jgi:osmoprotectant transport system ATP-binding protein